MKIYISGPIIGYPDNNEPAFNTMHQKIIEAGHTPINPHQFIQQNYSQKLYLKACIPKLIEATHIVLLDKWQYSSNSRSELTIATELGIKTLDTDLKP